MSNLDVTDYSSDLSRMEQRIRRTEARAGAEQELNRSQSGGEDVGSAFDNDERNSAIDSQLAALKQRLGGGSGSEETSSETRNLGSTGGK
jgi:phage shock protein A